MTPFPKNQRPVLGTDGNGGIFHGWLTMEGYQGNEFQQVYWNHDEYPSSELFYKVLHYFYPDVHPSWEIDYPLWIANIERISAWGAREHENKIHENRFSSHSYEDYWQRAKELRKLKIPTEDDFNVFLWSHWGKIRAEKFNNTQLFKFAESKLPIDKLHADVKNMAAYLTNTLKVSLAKRGRPKK